uniref:TLC domain-containing protein n=1 Tax=Alexandrium andersonii TaxID=327968 RepID=A0A7S2JE31_9DINO
MTMLFGVVVVCIAAHEAWIISQDVAGTLKDATSSLASLGTMARGSKTEIAALPMGPPDIPRDRRIFTVFAVTIFMMNWGLRLLVVEPFARVCVGLKGPQVAKFAQSTLEAVMYGGFAILGFWVVPKQDFVWPSEKWWRGFSEGGHEIMRLDLRCYYILYVSRYLQALVSVMMEFKRKDFLEMVIHHAVTIAVIYVSYIYGWNRVGVVVMVLLDPADVPLHLAKLCKYTAESSGRHLWQFLADRLFEVFGVTFFVTRIVFYGYVCWSAHVETTQFFPKGVPECFCLLLLDTLLVLQCYWFSLIGKVAMKMMRGAHVEDSRSDDEDEGPEEKKGK